LALIVATVDAVTEASVNGAAPTRGVALAAGGGDDVGILGSATASPANSINSSRYKISFDRVAPRRIL
jgi:hypothetical protein